MLSDWILGVICELHCKMSFQMTLEDDDEGLTRGRLNDWFLSMAECDTVSKQRNQSERPPD